MFSMIKAGCMRRLLLVDDNKDFLDRLITRLRPKLRNCQVLTAEGGMQAMTVLEARCVDLLMTDLRMPGMDGYELMDRAKKCCPQVSVYVMTTDTSQPGEHRAPLPEALNGMYRPINIESLAQFIAQELNVGTDQLQSR